MENTPLDTSRAIADWASASVIADQSARTLGDRPLATVSVCALAVATAPLAFVLTCGVRLLAVAELVRRPAPEATPLDDQDLPTYTVLVPIYRERSIVADLARRMRAIDYPADRLEVIVLTEEDDRETGLAVAEQMVGAPFRHVVVPPGSPRTKPRACNYGLAHSRGERVVVYDGEDRPEPDQLRKAAAALDADPNLAVVQCRLACDHAVGAPTVTKLWALDYDCLFGAVLPSLARADLLGGTSNHFRRDALLSVGAWDAHNVTEDADLAVRLARAGWRSAFVRSITWEEAPLSPTAWARQRSRWLKGFVVTSLVHMRRPRRLLTDLGWRRAAALYAQLPAALLSVAAFPLSLGLLSTGALDRSSPFTWLMALGNLGSLCLAVAVASSALRSPGVRVWLGLLLPGYWTALAKAMTLSLCELRSRRTHWSKTDHGLATRPPLKQTVSDRGARGRPPSRHKGCINNGD